MEAFKDQYRVLFQSNPLPMLVYDVETLAFLAANNAAIVFYGYSAAEFLTKNVFDLRPKEDHPKLKQVLLEITADPKALRNSGVWRHLKKDGTVVDVEISSQGLDFEGKAARLVLVKDMTEFVRSNAQLKLLETCIERLGDVVMITEAEPLDEPGPRIVFVNDAFEQHTGYTREEVTGRSPRMLQGPRTNRTTTKRVRRALEAGRSIREEIVNYHKDGHEIWLEMEITPVTNAAGRVTHFVSIERDVTARKRSQKALQLSESRLKEAQRVANIGSFEWNVSERRVIWSDEMYHIFGLVAQSVTITMDTFLKFIHADDRPKIVRHIEALRERPRSFTENYRIIQPSGEVRHLHSQGKFIANEDPQVARIVGTVQDVTDRMLAEEERLRNAKLEAANRELEAFSYSVSHDLRAPLRIVDGFGKMLADDYGKVLDDTGRGYLDLIQGAAQRMGQLIQDLLELSRVTSSEMHSTEVDLSALAGKVVEQLRRADPRRQVEVRITPGLTAQADPRLVRIVLENLLHNAWKFTGKVAHPRIEMGCQKKNGSRPFFISDNGAGFDMQFASKLFGVFQRLHQETEFAGTGVGLATVQRIIHRHGSKIWAESAADQGATFYFTLPEK